MTATRFYIKILLLSLLVVIVGLSFTATAGAYSIGAVNILYPVGGVNLTIGTEYEIKWDNSLLPISAHTGIYLKNSSNMISTLREQQNTGSYFWTIDNSLTAGNYEIMVKIYPIADDLSTYHAGFSGYFSIVNLNSPGSSTSGSSLSADLISPSVYISSPLSGSVVTGSSVSISAGAYDNVGVNKVEFYLANTLLHTSVSFPYTFLWNSSQVADGSYSIYAKAFDQAGNASTPSAINVIVDNVPDAGTSSNTSILPTTSTTTTPTLTTTTSSTTDQIYVDYGYVMGSVVDDASQPAKNISGYVIVKRPNGEITSYRGNIYNGEFSFSLPIGDYILEMGLFYGSGFKVGSGVPVNISSGITSKVELKVVPLDTLSYIKGYLKDQNGNIVKNVQAEVFAWKDGSWRSAQVNKATGEYNIILPIGDWYFGYHVDTSSGYTTDKYEKEFIKIGSHPLLKDIIAFKSDALLNISVVDVAGSPLSKAKISVMKKSFSEIQTATFSGYNDYYVGEWTVDDGGNVSLSLPAGNYYIHTYASTALGFINPGEKNVILASGETKSLSIIFKKPDSILSGKVLLDNLGIGAFVWAWSENGGYAETRSNTSGLYILRLNRNQDWHIGAGAEIGGFHYKSAEVAVNTSSEYLTEQNLNLRKIEKVISEKVEAPLEKVISQSVAVADGTEVALPANTISDTTKEHTVSIDPVVETPTQSSSRVVGTAYDIEIKDAAGTEIETLAKDITITIPYSEGDLDALGVTADSLQLAFWDEESSSWKVLENFIIDKEKKVVVGTVSHLTRFALIAPADITPPQAPSSVKAISVSGGSAKVSWVNPTSDFHHTKVYRSSVKGNLGTLVFNDVFTTEVTESLIAGSYYTVKSVDLAGNESKNTDQYQVGEAKAQEQLISSLNLIRVEGNPKVYRIVSGKKFWIPTEQAFITTGYNWSDIVLADQKTADSYPYTALAKDPNNPEVYFISENGTKRHIPNPQIFESYNYKWSDIIEIAKTEIDAYTQTILIVKQGDYRVYELRNNIKRWITTPEVLKKLSYEWPEIVAVNVDEFNFYQTGGNLE